MTRRVLILILLASASAQTGKHRALFTPPVVASFVQGTNCFHNFDGSRDCVVAYSSNVTAGDLLTVICTDFTNNPIGTMAVSDSQLNTYTQRVFTGSNPTTANSAAWLFTATAGSSAADTVTCRTSVGAEGNYRGAVLEYSALSTFDIGIGNNNNVGTTGVTNNLTTTATDVVFTFAFSDNSGGNFSVSSPAGYTQDYLSANLDVAIFRKNNVPAGAQAVHVVSLSATHSIHVGLYGMH